MSTKDRHLSVVRDAGEQAAELLSTPQLCAFLGITRDTLYEWREVGAAPPALKLPNGHLRFPRADVLAWLDNRRERAA